MLSSVHGGVSGAVGNGLRGLKRTAVGAIVGGFGVLSPVVPRWYSGAWELWRLLSPSLAVERASCERLMEVALKRTLRELPWYRARIAPAVLARADFGWAKARASGAIATILITKHSTTFPHGP